MNLQSQARESKENQGKSKGTKRENEGAKGSCKGKTLELGHVRTTETSWIHEEWSLDEGTMVGVLTSGMMMGMVLNGMQIVNKHMSHRYAHFHLKAENV